jgi:serine O-acetyltransferase
VLADALGQLPAVRRPHGTRARLALLLRVALTSAGFRATLLYRLGHTARGRGGAIGRIVAAFLYWIGRHWYGCSLASTARLHGGLVLPHPQGIVIGGDAVVGPGAWVFQNVTIGGAPERAGMPRIGADARIYAGAVVTGPVRVGDEVVIGANAVVSRDVPSRSAVRVQTVTTSPSGPG